VSPEIQALPILIVNPHSRCNCRCQMCDIWKTTDAVEIGADELRRQLASIEQMGVEWVVLSGGEPLMHSDLFSLCRALGERGVRITLLSTGLLIARHAAAIAEYVDDVIVSLDGPATVHDWIRGVPGAFERLRAGIRALRKKASKYPILGRSTIQRANCAHLRDTVKAARDLGLDSISFLPADLTSTAFNRPSGWDTARQQHVGLNGEELMQLQEEIEAIIADPDCRGFVVESADKLRRVVQHFRAQLGLAVPRAPRCNAPWVSAVLEADGTVRPCFFQPPIGSTIEGKNLAEILNGPRAVAFRAGLDVETNPICRNCVCSLHWKTNDESVGRLA
jgi:MoaA/NifB/PqqE/SkfB family radical SAM enzyme